VKRPRCRWSCLATKKKRVISAKSLANLRPNPSTCGLTGEASPRVRHQRQLDFLNYVLDGASKTMPPPRRLSKGINITSIMCGRLSTNLQGVPGKA